MEHDPNTTHPYPTDPQSGLLSDADYAAVTAAAAAASAGVEPPATDIAYDGHAHSHNAGVGVGVDGMGVNSAANLLHHQTYDPDQHQREEREYSTGAVDPHLHLHTIEGAIERAGHGQYGDEELGVGGSGEGMGVGVGVGVGQGLAEGDDEYKPQQQFYKKRAKLVMACHFCRRRKLKCDGVRPQCGNCEKRTEPCLWDDIVRRRGPGKRTKGMRDKANAEAHMAAALAEETSHHHLGVGVGVGAGLEGGEGLEYGHERGEGDAHAHSHEHDHEHPHSLSHAHAQEHQHEDQQVDPGLGAEAQQSLSDTNAALIAAVAAAARDTQDMGEQYDEFLPDGLKFQIDPALADGGEVAYGHHHEDSSAIDAAPQIGVGISLGGGEQTLVGQNGSDSLQDSAARAGAQQGQGIGVGVGVGAGVSASGRSGGREQQDGVQGQSTEGYEGFAQSEEEEEEGIEYPFTMFN